MNSKRWQIYFSQKAKVLNKSTQQSENLDYKYEDFDAYNHTFYTFNILRYFQTLNKKLRDVQQERKETIFLQVSNKFYIASII